MFAGSVSVIRTSQTTAALLTMTMAIIQRVTVVQAMLALLAVALLVIAVLVAVREESNDRTPRPSAAILQTSNIMWSHNDGHICLRESSAQFRIDVDAERDAVVIQEIIGPDMFTYEMVNTDALYKEATEQLGGIEGVDTAWIDALVGLKYNCVVENAGMNISSPAVLVERREDGVSAWNVGGWTVIADENLVPRSLSSSPSYDADDGDDDFHLIITEVGTCDIPVLGCDPLTEAGDDHIPYDGPSDAQMKAVLDAAGVLPEERGGGERLLGLWQDLQNGATRTNWCGQGTPKTNPCPGDPSIDIALYDYDADRACRRHDHGRKFKILTGFVRKECMHDRDLILASDNPILEAIYGRWGLAATFGCYGYGNYMCWKGWRYRCQCRGERIRYGSSRYDNNERNPDWGYYSPEDPSVDGGKLCSDDLWSCEGPNRSDKCNNVKEPKQAEGSC